VPDIRHILQRARERRQVLQRAGEHGALEHEQRRLRRNGAEQSRAAASLILKFLYLFFSIRCHPPIQLLNIYMPHNLLILYFFGMKKE
jgi:hypothetical protein